MKPIVAGVLLCLVPLTLVVGLVMVGATSESASATPVQVCVTSGPVRGLDTAAAANARIITAVAERKAGQAAAVIAVMTAWTESRLHVLGNPTVVPGGSVQGVGTDHDSIGLFQQRGSWGPVDVRLDPSLSTTAFVTRLVATPGWRTEQPWVAAQKVQVSAWDGTPRAANHGSSRYGGNYRANLTFAQRVVAQIDRDEAKHSCGALTGGLPASDVAGSRGLPGAYSIPATATPDESKVVAFAIAQLDKPYVFGAAGPDSYDCSGLVLAAWRVAGVPLPHSAAEQARLGTPTTADALVPGDLIFVPGDDGTLAAPGHVGIYLGSGLVLNAADEQDGIRVQTYANFLAVGHGLSALRHLK